MKLKHDSLRRVLDGVATARSKRALTQRYQFPPSHNRHVWQTPCWALRAASERGSDMCSKCAHSNNRYFAHAWRRNLQEKMMETCLCLHHWHSDNSFRTPSQAPGRFSCKYLVIQLWWNHRKTKPPRPSTHRRQSGLWHNFPVVPRGIGLSAGRCSKTVKGAVIERGAWGVPYTDKYALSIAWLSTVESSIQRGQSPIDFGRSPKIDFVNEKLVER